MRSEVWRPAAAARNRAPGGPGHRPPGTIRPGCEELAARVAEECRRRKRGPRPKIATVERREASVLRYWTQGASQAPGVLRHCTPDGVSSAHSVRLSALRPPLGGGYEITTRAPSRRGNEYGCLTSEEMNVATPGVAARRAARACALSRKGRATVLAVKRFAMADCL